MSSLRTFKTLYIKNRPLLINQTKTESLMSLPGHIDKVSKVVHGTDDTHDRELLQPSQYYLSSGHFWSHLKSEMRPLLGLSLKTELRQKIFQRKSWYPLDEAI